MALKLFISMIFLNIYVWAELELVSDIKAADGSEESTTCPQGTSLRGGFCTQPANPYCLNDVYTNGFCQQGIAYVCPNGGGFDNGVCNSITIKTCPEGRMVGDACVVGLRPTCPENTTLDDNNMCRPQCPEGSFARDGGCYRCPDKSRHSNGACLVTRTIQSSVPPEVVRAPIAPVFVQVTMKPTEVVQQPCFHQNAWPFLGCPQQAYRQGYYIPK